MLNTPFEVILSMPWLPNICPWLGTREFMQSEGLSWYKLPTIINETATSSVGQALKYEP